MCVSTADTKSATQSASITTTIVWGPDRETAIARTIRALDEMIVEGVFTTIPADLAILRHPDFHAVKHSTKWVEESLDLSSLDATTGQDRASQSQETNESLVERSTVVEVNGKRFTVKVWVPEISNGLGKAKKAPRARGSVGVAVGSGDVIAPMQGTIIKVIATVNQAVKVGDAIVVLEAMKMENQIAAEKSGTVSKINVKAGDIVGAGDVLVVID